MLKRNALVLSILFLWGQSSLAAPPIDRKVLVTRHNPILHKLDVDAPLTVGNGGFAFGADITGLQTFAEQYFRRGIPVETLSRWGWHSQLNPNNYRLADTNQDFQMPDGRVLGFPTRQSTPAGDWLRKNPHNHPLGQLALEWLKPDGSAFLPEDIQNPEQVLDLWRGVITSWFELGGEAVSVTTACAPDSDTIAVRIKSRLVERGNLHVRLAFPRGYDMSVKNTPGLDWSHPEAHESKLMDKGIPGGALIQRKIDETRYAVVISAPAIRNAPHIFRIAGNGYGRTLEFAVQFVPGNKPVPAALPSVAHILADSAAYWQNFWTKGAAVDFSGSSNPLARKLEERIVQG
jgi:hypothetical protein